MSVDQKGMTLVIPVAAGKDQALSDYILALDSERAFDDLSQLHFLSMTILPASEKSEASMLVIEFNIDEPLDDFVEELWHRSKLTVQALLEHCEPKVPASVADLVALFDSYDRGEGAYFRALRGADIPLIRNTQKLFNAAKEWFESSGKEYPYPRDTCAEMVNDKNVKKYIQVLPGDWPGNCLKKIWLLVQPLISFFFTVIVLIGSGLGYTTTETEVSILQSLALFWGLVLLLLIVVLVKLLNEWERNSEEGSGKKYANAGIYLIAGIALIIIFCEIVQQDLFVSLIWFLAILIFWFVGLLVGLNKLRKTEYIEEYVKHIATHVTALMVLLLCIQFLELPSVSIAAAILSGGLVLFAVVANLLRKLIIPTGAGAVGSGLALLVLILAGGNLIIGYRIALVFCLLAIVVLYAVIRALCALEAQEKQEVESPPIWPPGDLRDKISKQESSNHKAQNHLISYTTIKPGKLRYAALRLVLFFTGLTIALKGKRGELSGITTIHFARWLIIDKYRLLFLTNYYGTWDSYLDEFIDQASGGLTGIWTNTVGFPRSQWLNGGGAKLEQRFKIYARRSQVQTLYHYQAYPDLSVDQIEDHLKLNKILSNEDRTDADCEAVLRML